MKILIHKLKKNDHNENMGEFKNVACCYNLSQNSTFKAINGFTLSDSKRKWKKNSF